MRKIIGKVLIIMSFIMVNWMVMPHSVVIAKAATEYSGNQTVDITALQEGDIIKSNAIVTGSDTSHGLYFEYGYEVSIYGATVPIGEGTKTYNDILTFYNNNPTHAGFNMKDRVTSPTKFIVRERRGSDLILTGENDISVTVSPAISVIAQGGTKTFSAVVSGTDLSHNVTWTISGENSTGTIITTGGVLTVASDETATNLTVKATSEADTSKSGTAAVTVSKKIVTSKSQINGYICNHDYEWDVEKAPTETEDGEAVYKCTKCGNISARQPLTAYQYYILTSTNKIKNAKAGSTVTISSKYWNSFPKSFFEQLAKRRDITVKIDFPYDSKNYEITISPTQKIDTSNSKVKYYGPKNLIGTYNAVEVKAE